MKVCMIGKYPPIQGGVSVRNYWMARGLAQRGHEIHMVTNAMEVESEFRTALTPEDEAWRRSEMPEAAGSVHLVDTPPVTKRLRYIPWANPYVTKLATLATRTVREHRCDVIYAYYFEPYGIAGYLASQWTGVPLIVKHAGSDLGRLMELEELRTAYEEILRAAALVVTPKPQAARLQKLGIEPRAIFSQFKFSVATEQFKPEGDTLDVAAYRRLARERGDETVGAEDPDLSKPTFGIYGKLGETKGSYDLLRALARLHQEGRDFNLLAMTHGWEAREKAFHDLIRDSGLESKVWTLPFIPTWRVPSFLRTCDAVCFLERDFPIVDHAPTVAREVMACGTCLVLSLEIARKQASAERLVHRDNVLIVRDPRDHAELADSLRYVLDHPEEAARIGAAGLQHSRAIEDYPRFIDSCEEMLELVTAGETASQDRDDGASGLGAQRIESWFPYTARLLGDDLPSVAEQTVGDGMDLEDPDWSKVGPSLRSVIVSRSDGPSVLADILEYELMCLALPGPNGQPTLLDEAFFRGDKLPAKAEPADVDGDLVPFFLSTQVQVRRFEHEIDQLVESLEAVGQATEVEEVETSLLFFQGSQVGPRTFKLTHQAAALLEQVDGRHSVQDLCEQAARQGDFPTSAVDDLNMAVRSLLVAMWRMGVLSFR